MLDPHRALSWAGVARRICLLRAPETDQDAELSLDFPCTASMCGAMTGRHP
jgi:hypothetical protein